MTITDALDQIARLSKENDLLRGLLAKGGGDCVYCQLPAGEIAKCPAGFPGCGRMDDIANAIESAEINRLTGLHLTALGRLVDIRVLVMDVIHELAGHEGESETVKYFRSKQEEI